MCKVGRVSPRSATTRTDILRAARTLIETAPFAEVTLGRVASAAGVSRQAVYLHFGSKSQLLLALVTWMDQHGRLPRLLAAAGQSQDPVQALLEAVKGAASYNADVAGVGLALRAARQSDPAAAQAWEDRMAGRINTIRGFVQPLADAGRLRPQWNAVTASDAIFALISLTVYEDLVKERGWSRRRYADHVVSIIHHAFIAPEPGNKDLRGSPPLRG